MKIIAVHSKAKPEKRNKLIALCKSMIAPSRAEAGCISYTFFQDITDENKFFFYEEWKDQTAIDFHFATPHFLAFQKQFAALLSEPETIKIHNT